MRILRVTLLASALLLGGLASANSGERPKLEKVTHKALSDFYYAVYGYGLNQRPVADKSDQAAGVVPVYAVSTVDNLEKMLPVTKRGETYYVDVMITVSDDPGSNASAFARLGELGVDTSFRTETKCSARISLEGLPAINDIPYVTAIRGSDFGKQRMFQAMTSTVESDRVKRVMTSMNDSKKKVSEVVEKEK